MLPQFQLHSIEATTNGAVKRLRKAGLIPVSLQHKGRTTRHFQQETKRLEEFLSFLSANYFFRNPSLLLYPEREPDPMW